MTPKLCYDLLGKRVWVAGHTGMVGSALVRRLKREGCTILTVGREQLDLTRQADVENWVAANQPDLVFWAAAKVGGIVANRDYPADFAYINQVMQTNAISACYQQGVEKFIFLGSACMYPRAAAQPLVEHQIMSGPLEVTNEAYGVAKIAGMQLCQSYRQQYGSDFVTVLPTNSYGPGDNYDLETGHVPAAIMVKCHRARVEGRPAISVWGSGAPTRDFLHVDDMADGIVRVAKYYSDIAPINISSGQEVSIQELVTTICEATGFSGQVEFDSTKPDGALRKVLANSKLAQLGWAPEHTLLSGMKHAYDWYKKNSDLGF